MAQRYQNSLSWKFHKHHHKQHDKQVEDQQFVHLLPHGGFPALQGQKQPLQTNYRRVAPTFHMLHPSQFQAWLPSSLSFTCLILFCKLSWTPFLNVQESNFPREKDCWHSWDQQLNSACIFWRETQDQGSKSRVQNACIPVDRGGPGN